jgi:hypothetical protein
MLDAIEAMRVSLGPGIVLSHVLQGLFHPARKVREVRLLSLRSLLLLPDTDSAITGVLDRLQLPPYGRARRPRRSLPLPRTQRRTQRLRARRTSLLSFSFLLNSMLTRFLAAEPPHVDLKEQARRRKEEGVTEEKLWLAVAVVFLVCIVHFETALSTLSGWRLSTESGKRLKEKGKRKHCFDLVSTSASHRFC